MIDRHSQQQFRSLLASLEILAAAAVSNALVLGSFVRDRGAKKQRYRFDSVAGSSSLDRAAGPRWTITARHWGSDADLVEDVGMRLQEGLSADESRSPRPAPIAIPPASQANHLTPSVVDDDEDWAAFQEQSSAEAAEMGRKNRGTGNNKNNNKNKSSQPPKRKPAPSRRLSFFDVGGLLDDDNSKSACYPTLTRQSQASGNTGVLFRTRTETENESEEYNNVHRNRRGKEALTKDMMGGPLIKSSTWSSGPIVSDRRRDRHQSSIKDSFSSRPPPSAKGSGKNGMKSEGDENTGPSLNDVGRLLA